MSGESLYRACQGFIEKKYNLIEFQQRLETAIFPEYLERCKFEYLNAIEVILFTRLEPDFYRFGLEVANRILRELSREGK